MFQLDSSNAQITNLNLRAEKYGDENQPACTGLIVPTQ